MTDAIKHWIEKESGAKYGHISFSEGLTKGIEITTGFAEWYPSEGWQNYDGHDRWINPAEGNSVLTTSQLLEKYLDEINKKSSVL